MIFIFLVFFGLSAHASNEVDLPSIVKKGSPAEALGWDPITPLYSKKTQEASGSGGVEHSLTNSLPFPVVENGEPGGFSQFRGLGRTAEDIDVEAFGVPVNSPQGGGFDFSTFPQFLWSDFRYQTGPSIGAFDPRGVAGSLMLVPWTEQALRSASENRFHGRGFYSSAGTEQVSAGARSHEDYAVVAGHSFGKVKGASGGASVQRALNESTKTTFHFIGTNVDAESPGTLIYPTPHAHNRTARIIPVLQADTELGPRELLKNSVFYDGAIIRYDDPDSGFKTLDKIHLVGTENAFLTDDWRMGVGFRHVIYKKLDFDAPHEEIFNAQVTRSINHGTLLIEPTLQIAGVSRFGILPQGSIGARHGLDGDNVLFARASYSRRVPSLQDRYYFVPGFFSGNPGLQPEKDWTLTQGFESRAGDFAHALQMTAQFREDAQVTTKTSAGLDTPANLGSATVFAMTHSARYKLREHVDLSNSFTLSQSNLSSSATEFPYLPRFIDVAGLRVHALGDTPVWEALAQARFSSSALAPSGNRVGGYGYLDLSYSHQILKQISITGGFENVFDRRLEFVEGSPVHGRAVFVLAKGEL